MPIRKKFKQYINFRPVKLLKGVSCRFTGEDIDFVIIRENAEGEYSNSGGRLYQGHHQEIAVQNTIITRTGTEKAARFAFEYAQKHGKGTVTSATKSNAIIHSMKLWDEAVREVGEEFKLLIYKVTILMLLQPISSQNQRNLKLLLLPICLGIF